MCGSQPVLYFCFVCLGSFISDAFCVEVIWTSSDWDASPCVDSFSEEGKSKATEAVNESRSVYMEP